MSPLSPEKPAMLTWSFWLRQVCFAKSQPFISSTPHTLQDYPQVLRALKPDGDDIKPHVPIHIYTSRLCGMFRGVLEMVAVLCGVIFVVCYNFSHILRRFSVVWLGLFWGSPSPWHVPWIPGSSRGETFFVAEVRRAKIPTGPRNGSHRPPKRFDRATDPLTSPVFCRLATAEVFCVPRE